jgi:2-oxoglutarate ferredoxin oxidoreductase subunit alpha
LLYALHTAHGEFPRVIFAPGTPEQAVYLTNKAFDVAEKYQIPVFVVFDTYLADSQVTCGGIDRKRISFTDYRMRGGELENLPGYKRHVVTGTGVSPLAVPGASRHLVVTDSDEHNEEGHIREDAETRRVMVEKRLMKKMPLIRQEIAPPFLCGAVDPDVVLTGWGSTYGVLKEAVDELSKNVKVGMLHFAEVYPFPPTEPFDYLSLLRNAGLTLCIENNATGQFARLMRAETGYVFTARINRYDGRPFTREGLLTEIMAFLNRDLPQR